MHVQVHEWGGTFKNLVMHAHFRRFRPGLRIAVNLFGGHYWRTQVACMADPGPETYLLNRIWDSNTQARVPCMTTDI